MTRLSRLVLGVALVSGAACSGSSTAPAPNTTSPGIGELTVSGDTTCKAGWETPNGRC